MTLDGDDSVEKSNHRLPASRQRCMSHTASADLPMLGRPASVSTPPGRSVTYRSHSGCTAHSLPSSRTRRSTSSAYSRARSRTRSACCPVPSSPARATPRGPRRRVRLSRAARHRRCVRRRVSGAAGRGAGRAPRVGVRCTTRTASPRRRPNTTRRAPGRAHRWRRPA